MNPFITTAMALFYGSSIPGILEQAAKVKTPIGLAALSFVVLYLLYREIIRKSSGVSSKGLERIIRSVFLLAIVALCLGFGAYIVHTFYAADPFVRIYGRVVAAQNTNVAIPNASVFIHVDTTATTPAAPNGDFAFVLPASYIGRTAKIWASASGFQDAPTRQVRISPITENLQLPMTHLAMTDSVPANPKCISGAWLEKPGGGYVWQITMADDTAHIRRGDGWAEGDFHFQDSVWLGSLHWGNGDDWTGISLSPNSTCTTLSTNKDWWYVRQ